MTRIKVGDSVRVVSKCKSYGMTGIVKQVNNPILAQSIAHKSVDVTMPHGETYTFSPRSLELVVEAEEDSQYENIEKKIGIFSMENFNFSGEYWFDEDVMYVNAYSVEHCLKIHNDLVGTEIDPYWYLMFDGKVYELEEKTVSYVAGEIVQ